MIDKDGVVCQRNDFYPFGTPFISLHRTINECNQPYKYNGKEFDMMHGLNTYDYGARQYSPILPMWDRVDPLAEKYYNVSPYAYCMNDPVNCVDPDGRYITYVNGKYSYIYSNGYFYVNRRSKSKNGNWIVTGAKVNVPKSATHMYRTLNALRKMDNSKNPYIKKVFDTVSDINDNYEHQIRKTKDFNRTKAEMVNESVIRINFDLVDNYKTSTDFVDIGLTDSELIGHELKHSYNQKFKKSNSNIDTKSKIKIEEIDAVLFENQIRKEEGDKKRTKYTNDIPEPYLNEKPILWN